MWYRGNYFPLSIGDDVTTKKKLNKITNHKQDAASWESAQALNSSNYAYILDKKFCNC